MKKLFTLFSILLVSACIITGYSQTITLKVDKSCTPHIMMGNTELKNDNTYDLPLAQGQSLQFFLDNQTNGKEIQIAIKSLDGSIDCLLKDNFFKQVNPLLTDNKLNIVLNGRAVNFNRPFQLYIACTEKPMAAIMVTIDPRVSTTPAATNIAGSSTATTPSDSPEPAPAVYHPGSAIHDALYLSGNPENIKREDFLKIMKYYLGDAATSAENIPAHFTTDNNTFLSAIITDDYIKALQGDAVAKAQSDLGGIFSDLSFSSIGGLDVTNIADGLAKFLVKRTKQELSIAFFQKFKDIIDSTKDFGTLFPETSNLLHAIDNDIYDYEKYIQNLREAFKKDIASIHRNLPGIIDHHKDFFKRHPDLEAALRSGCYIAIELENQAHPADILANYPAEYLDVLPNKNPKGAIQTIQLLSASLRDTVSSPDAGYWVNIKKIRDLVNNRRAFKIYWGLVYEEAKNKYDDIHFENFTLIDVLQKIAADYDTVYSTYDVCRRYVQEFGSKADALNKMIKEYSKPATDSAAFEQYARYFRASVDLIEYATKATTLPVVKDKLPDLEKLLHQYFVIAYSTSDLTVDIIRKNYSAAINDAIHIYEEIKTKPAEKDAKDIGQQLTKKEKKLVDKYNKALVTLEKLGSNKLNDTLKKQVDSILNLNNSTSAISQLLKADSVNKQATTFKNTLTNLTKYGSFMSTVATAKTSDQVAQAIEAAALPVGSSRVKRESPFNVSLNAYAGLFIGHESIQGIKDGQAFNTYGVTAPIGISISRGHSVFFLGTGKSGWKENKYGWSTSLFISLIDIGAVTAFRFKNDSAQTVPTIQLKNILAPGAFISIGIPKSPLSMNFGAQMGPNLRKIDNSNPAAPVNDYSNRIYWRFSTSLCVDIPLFNLYTKSR